jgi:type IV secretion system protein TrbL
MVDGLVLNRIGSAFSIALDGAYAALTVYSLGLLAILALMHFQYTMSLVVAGSALMGEALSAVFWTVIKIGIFYFLLQRLYDLMWNGAFKTFAQWGLLAGGGVFSYESFLNPGTILINGFRAAYPMKVFADQFIGPTLPFFLVDLSLAMLAYGLTVLSFGFLALHVLMTLIEVKMAIATGAVLIPWAVLTQTAFLGELSIAWIVAGLVRVLVTAVIMGIAIPLYSVLALPVPVVGGPDPSAYQSVSMAIVSLIFAVVAWVVPARAAGIGGRGMAIALSGEHLVSGGMAGLAGARTAWGLAGEAIHGRSRLRA